MTERGTTAGRWSRQAGGALFRAWRSVRWYVKEVVGENDYEHYVRHLRAHHGEAEPVTRRAFERAKTDRMESHPKSRCC